MPIFWLNGMAETGQSTISHTIAQSVVINGHYGADLVAKEPATAPYVKEKVSVPDSSVSVSQTA